MTSPFDRKKAIREYKERKTPRGVYAVRCTATGQVWVDASPNLNAAPNGMWFSLRLGSHRNKALQEAWNAHGAEALQFETVEKFDDDLLPMELSDRMKERKLHWVKQFGALAM